MTTADSLADVRTQLAEERERRAAERAESLATLTDNITGLHTIEAQAVQARELIEDLLNMLSADFTLAELSDASGYTIPKLQVWLAAARKRDPDYIPRKRTKPTA